MLEKRKGYGTFPEVWRAISGNPLSLAGLAVIIALVICAVVAPYVAPYDPLETRPRERLSPPSPAHPLGTDQLGRDILSRLLYGAQISLRIAAIVAFIAGVGGTIIGLLCGYFGGVLDDILMRLTDVFMAFPQLILAMAISSALGPSLENAIIAISLTEWTVFARLARSRALAIREETYIEAAQASGAGRARILFRHVLPLTLSPIVVQVSLEMGTIIRTAASLGFLGLGAQPPTPEWGVMVTAGRNYLPGQWWVSTFPGLVIFLTVLGFNLLGDGIRDVLDPRLRHGA
ncbi:MAG: nickel transporter permease [Candidatus Bipolaricaulaceae bacterium]